MRSCWFIVTINLFIHISIQAFHSHIPFLFSIHYNSFLSEQPAQATCNPIYHTTTDNPSYYLELNPTIFATNNSIVELQAQPEPYHQELIAKHTKTPYIYNAAGCFIPTQDDQEIKKIECKTPTYSQQKKYKPFFASSKSTHIEDARSYWHHNTDKNSRFLDISTGWYAYITKWIIDFCQNDQDIVEKVKNLYNQSVELITTLKKASSWFIRQVTSFWNWITGKNKVPTDFSYEKYVQNNPYKMDALQSCQHIQALLELACTGSVEEQIAARLALFQTEFPQMYTTYMQAILTNFFKYSFDAEHNFIYDANFTQAYDEIYDLFKNFYTHIATVTWQAYAKMDDNQAAQELKLTTTSYAKTTQTEQTKALCDMVQARLHHDICNLYAIQNAYPKNVSIQNYYKDATHSMVQEIKNLYNPSNLPDDVALMQNYLVEEIWPYLGTHDERYLAILYELLPKDSSIFTINTKNNYYIWLIQKYVEEIVTNHTDLLDTSGIIPPFQTHPYIEKYFTPACTSQTSLLMYANFALIIANMYQDHQTQELAYNLLYTAYTAYINKDMNLQTKTEKLYEQLTDLQYQPAYHAPTKNNLKNSYPYSLHTTADEKRILLQESISPAIFEHLYVSKEQETLLDQCKQILILYTTQKDSYLVHDLYPLILHLLHDALYAIHHEEYIPAAQRIHTALSILSYSKTCTQTYEKAKKQHIANTLSSVMGYTVSDSELILCAARHHKTILKEVATHIAICSTMPTTNITDQTYLFIKNYLHEHTHAGHIQTARKQDFVQQKTLQQHFNQLINKLIPEPVQNKSWIQSCIIKMLTAYEYSRTISYRLQFASRYYVATLYDSYQKYSGTDMQTKKIANSLDGLWTLTLERAFHESLQNL